MLALAALASAGSFAGAQTKALAKVGNEEGPLRFVVAATGNEARYRVREQLVNLDLPNDAVGITHDISGMLMVNPNGSIIAEGRVIRPIEGSDMDGCFAAFVASLAKIIV